MFNRQRSIIMNTFHKVLTQLYILIYTHKSQRFVLTSTLESFLHVDLPSFFVMGQYRKTRFIEKLHLFYIVLTPILGKNIWCPLWGPGQTFPWSTNLEKLDKISTYSTNSRK